MDKIKNYSLKMLRKLEPYTKTDMVYLAKGGFWLNLNFIISSFFSFVLSIALAHFIPKETYGTYQYLLSLSAIFTAFSLTGMNSAITQSVARGYDGSFVKSLIPQLRWGLISSAMALGSSLYYAYKEAYILSISLIIIAILLPVINATNTYTAFFTGKKDFKKIFLYNNTFNLVYTIGMIATVIYTKNPFHLIFVYFLINSIINSFLFLKSLKKVNLESKVDSNTIPYAKHLSVMGIIATVVSKIDSILVFHYLGAANLAIYTFAKVIPEKIGGAFKSLSSMAFPKFSEKENHEVHSTIMYKTLIFASFILFCSIVYIIISPFLFQTFFPKYIESIKYSQIFSLSLFVSAASLPVYALMSQRAKKELYILNTVSPTVQLIILFTMLYMWGIWGLVFSKIISGVIHLFLSIFLAQKKT